MMIVVNALILGLFPALMAFAASSDLLTMKISNRLVLMLLAGFLAVSVLTGMSGATVLNHLGSGAIVLAAGFACYAFGWIGGGDAKFAAAVALWFGMEQIIPFLLYASILGGLLTLAVLRFRNEPLPALLANQPWILRLHQKDAGVPYGIALAAAALLIYPNTGIMQQVVM